MNVVRAAVILIVTLSFAVGFALGTALLPGSNIVQAYGVVSRCGVHAVIVVRADGSSEMFDGTRPADDETTRVVNSLPDEKRSGVLVPCDPAGFAL